MSSTNLPLFILPPLFQILSAPALSLGNLTTCTLDTLEYDTNPNSNTPNVLGAIWLALGFHGHQPHAWQGISQDFRQRLAQDLALAIPARAFEIHAIDNHTILRRLRHLPYQEKKRTSWALVYSALTCTCALLTCALLTCVCCVFC